MPDIETYSFTHRELLALMIKAAGFPNGDWQLSVNLGFSAGNFGPDDQNMNPGAAVMIAGLAIAKAKPESPRGLVMNAKEAKSFPTA